MVRRRILGRGRFGVVYEDFADDGQPFALKMVAKSRLSARELRRVRQEADLHFLFNHRDRHHPNVCRLLGVRDSARAMWFAFELCDASLYDRVRSGPLPVHRVKSIAADVARGLNYMHSFNVIHRDVKPANILLSEAQAKVGDLSLAAKGPLAKGLAGTPRYVAPEVLRGVPYGYTVDVWGLGCCIYAMLSAPEHPRHAFCADTRDELFARVKAMKHAMPLPLPCDSLLRGIFTDPSVRVDLSAVAFWADSKL
jgi:serine/threonine protein kinase